MASPQPKQITLTGNNLTIREIQLATKNPEVTVVISATAFSAVQKSREFLEQELEKRIIYGVNTGFGPMASHIINHGQLVRLQENLIRSHAVGIGSPIDERYVLASMIVRLNTLVKGYSGVSVELIEHLQKFINKRILPIVPEHGAVGASGDLVQLAHIALALIGEGEVIYQGKRQATRQVLNHLGISPYQLKPKEGLSLINGTSAMTGIAVLVCAEASQLLSIAVRLGACALEVIHGYDDSIAETLHRIRPHHGQNAAARALRNLLASSRMLRKREQLKQPPETNTDVIEIPDTVQEFYSLRCISQILGPVLDTLLNTQKIVEVEMNAASDNPIVDWENKAFLHGGNFHGDYIAAAVDQLKMTLIKLTMLSERRINFFLNRRINEFFPPFMNLHTPGLTLGLQGLQFVATSTTAQSQSLAFPHYVHSISTNGDNQDVVSMGTDATLFAMKVINNAYVVLAIELITLAQAIDFLKEQQKLSESSKWFYEQARELFPVLVDDREVTQELPRIVQFLKQNEQLKIADY